MPGVEMANIGYDRIVRKLDEAEGYLMLEMPLRALEILRSRDDWATMQFEASLLTGEALRATGRYREALKPLEIAAALRPTDLGAALALGWCYKRTHRLAQAIDALERAVPAHPEEGLLQYNLACYWSLAGNVGKALKALTAALTIDPDFHKRIDQEPDFEAIRASEEFTRLVSRKAPSA